MYIEASSPRKAGEIAKLVVIVPNNGNPACLSFYYHMYGASAGTLNVYSGNNKVFHATGDQGDNWLIVERKLYLDEMVRNHCLSQIYLNLAFIVPVLRAREPQKRPIQKSWKLI